MITFSIVVNTTDRELPLRTLLRALEHQSYPHFEVVVVVGPTKDNTHEMLQEYEGRVRIFTCEQANLSQSRNIGLAAARGDVVAYIDDDAVPCHHWLQQLAKLFDASNLDATGGIVYLVHPNQPAVQHRIGTVSPLAEQHDVRDSWFDPLSPEDVSRQWIPRMMGTNMAYRRQALLDIGGFDEFYQWVYDDTDVALRLANAGKVIHPVLEAPVYHIPASSRNRKAFTYTGRWWIGTKAAVYFSFKNGRDMGHTWRDIGLRSLHLVHGRWLWTGEVWRYKHITAKDMWHMRYQEIKSGAQGALSGYTIQRKTLATNPVESARAIDQAHSFQPFPNNKTIYPSVDPVSGRRPSISMTEQPLRICILSSTYPPHHFEGVGRLANLMAQGLFELGHTVHVVTRSEWQSSERASRDLVTFYDGAYVHQLPYHTQRYQRYQHYPRLHHTLNYSHAVHDKVKRMILNDGIQVVDSPIWQVDGLVTAQSGILPVCARLQTATRQIAELQQERDPDAWFVGEMERTLIESATHVTPNSLATAQATEQVYGVTNIQDRSTIVPHGIIPVAGEAVRPFNLETPPSTLTVLYIGRMEKRKGILQLFEAIPHVMRKVDHVQFVCAGADNSQSDGFYTRTGMTYADYFARRYHKYSAAVTFLGQVSDEKLQELYQTCDLLVAPSLYESFGLIYVEAMNYAKPVIGCRAGGIPEVIDSGVTGLLAEPEDSKSLAEAMITVLQSPQKLYEMGLAGRQRLLDNFTHIQMARKYAEVYRRVIAESNTST
ncbi:MAG: glycosyltransferase [Chloroflexota bacterium]